MGIVAILKVLVVNLIHQTFKMKSVYFQLTLLTLLSIHTTIAIFIASFIAILVAIFIANHFVNFVAIFIAIFIAIAIAIGISNDILTLL